MPGNGAKSHGSREHVQNPAPMEIPKEADVFDNAVTGPGNLIAFGSIMVLSTFLVCAHREDGNVIKVVGQIVLYGPTRWQQATTASGVQKC